ncbi:MAG: hypothetical protein E6I34_04095 [Chloroflexi bacterium]|nr:MAG: hypothetical protein E6I34_04095 [Chloroflexota bacterium]
MSRAQMLRYGAIAVGLVVVIAVGVAAFQALQVPFQPPQSPPNSAPCSPPPCANLRGYILWVTDLKTNGGLVTMNVTFRNSSNSTHAEPDDLRLVDSQNNVDEPVFDAPGCTRWPRTDFNNGATFGPEQMCFRPASVGAPLVLRWSPDEGLFCCQTDVKLTGYQNAPSPSST